MSGCSLLRGARTRARAAAGRDGWDTTGGSRGDSAPPSAGHNGHINLHAHFDHSPTSPGSARGLVRTALADYPVIDVRDTAELLISELVTNALLHAGTELDVHVECDSDTVRIAVDDGSAAAPVLGTPDSDDLGGRGLPLVAILATRWGWEPLPSGKRVWFEV